MYDLRDHKCILYSEVLGRCNNLSLYMYVRIAKLFFFQRFKNFDTGDNRGADFHCNTVIPVQKELTDMFFKYANKEKAIQL